MTTKQQEREALAKIRKIVEGLGADSYVATAFEGCFEIAEENIENDFACSMKQRYDMADAEAVKAQQAHYEAQQRIKALESQVASYEASIKNLQEQVEHTAEIAKWNGDQVTEARTSAGEAQRRAETAEAEVIRLKAKLYDYMTAGA